MFETTLLAWCRRLGLPDYAEGNQGRYHINPRGNLLASQDLPERTEIVRLGDSWAKQTDAVAAVTALPTTTAAHTLWNGEPPGATAKTYVIDAIGWVCTTSNAAASRFTMVVCNNILPVTAVPATSDTQATVSTLNGRPYPGRAKTSHTVTVVNDLWWPIGQSAETALSATVGASLWVDVRGLLQVQPGGLLGVSIIAQSTTAVGRLVYVWHEVPLPERL